MKKETTAPTSKKNSSLKAEVLKIGIHIHKSKYVVVAQYDCEAPKAPQSFKPEEGARQGQWTIVNKLKPLTPPTLAFHARRERNRLNSSNLT